MAAIPPFANVAIANQAAQANLANLANQAVPVMPHLAPIGGLPVPVQVLGRSTTFCIRVGCGGLYESKIPSWCPFLVHTIVTSGNVHFSVGPASIEVVVTEIRGLSLDTNQVIMTVADPLGAVRAFAAGTVINQNVQISFRNANGFGVTFPGAIREWA